MPDQTVPAAEQPDHFADLAAELRRVADDISNLIGSGLPKPGSFMISIQPGTRGDVESTVRSVDAVANYLLGHPGQVQKMGGGAWHYGADHERRGPVTIAIYQSIDTAWAEQHYAASQLAAREAELAKLQAEVDELRKQAAR